MAEEGEKKEIIPLLINANSVKLLVSAINPSYGNPDKKNKFEAIRKKEELSGDDFEEFLKEPVILNQEKTASYQLNYDAPTNSLEPLYFYILDLMNDFKMGPEKLVDNFASAPGSGHFSDLGMKATRLQEEGMKVLGSINLLVKAILNLLYDLKEFEIRLGHYGDANSTNPETKKIGMLSLKQIWMDNVDIKKGGGSINQMTLSGFSTLRDAFMISDTIPELQANEIVNEEIKRILIPRLSEFIKWRELSEQELRKRFAVEKSYLKSQVETLKLYTSWAMPYIKSANDLKMRGFDTNAALVNAFNTAMFELVLFGSSPMKPADLAADRVWKLPPAFREHEFKRKYFSCWLVSLKFRGIPQKVTQQHYAFGGRVEISFDCFALNNEELKFLKDEIKKQSVIDGLSLLKQETGVTLEQLGKDLDHFTNDDKGAEAEKKKKEEKEKEKIQGEDTNPFSALISVFKKGEEAKKPEEKKSGVVLAKIKPDDFFEKEVRILAEKNAKEGLSRLYEIFKKAQGFFATPEAFIDTGAK